MTAARPAAPTTALAAMVIMGALPEEVAVAEEAALAAELEACEAADEAEEETLLA